MKTIAPLRHRVHRASRSNPLRSLNLNALNFTRTHVHDDGHGATTDFAIGDELGVAIARVEGNLELFSTMRAGDRQKIAHFDLIEPHNSSYQALLGPRSLTNSSFVITSGGG